MKQLLAAAIGVVMLNGSVLAAPPAMAEQMMVAMWEMMEWFYNHTRNSSMGHPDYSSWPGTPGSYNLDMNSLQPLSPTNMTSPQNLMATAQMLNNLNQAQQLMNSANQPQQYLSTVPQSIPNYPQTAASVPPQPMSLSQNDPTTPSAGQTPALPMSTLANQSNSPGQPDLNTPPPFPIEIPPVDQAVRQPQQLSATTGSSRPLASQTNKWQVPYVLTGLWRSRSGETLLVKGEFFRLQAGSDRMIEGKLLAWGNYLVAYNQEQGIRSEYRFLHEEDILVLKDSLGQAILFQRDNSALPSSGGAYPGN